MNSYDKVLKIYESSILLRESLHTGMKAELKNGKTIKLTDVSGNDIMYQIDGKGKEIHITQKALEKKVKKWLK